jgi:hypothetical protein
VLDVLSKSWRKIMPHFYAESARDPSRTTSLNPASGLEMTGGSFA